MDSSGVKNERLGVSKRFGSLKLVTDTLCANDVDQGDQIWQNLTV